MTNIEIRQWLKEQNYQTEYEETGEYKMYYELNMPKILNDYLASQPNEIKTILKDVMQDYWFLLQCYANRSTPYSKEVEGFEAKHKRIMELLGEEIDG